MQNVEHPVSLSEDTHYDAHSDVYDHGYDPSDQGRASEDEGHSASTATHTVSKHLVLLAYPAVYVCVTGLFTSNIQSIDQAGERASQECRIAGLE